MTPVFVKPHKDSSKVAHQLDQAGKAILDAAEIEVDVQPASCDLMTTKKVVYTTQEGNFMVKVKHWLTKDEKRVVQIQAHVIKKNGIGPRVSLLKRINGKTV